VLFAATDPKSGYELWATDGTAAGTRLVKDLHPGTQWSVPVGLTPFAGRVFFAADDSFVPNPDGTATFDRELFATDGTAAGTVRFADINPGPQPSIPFHFTTLAKQLLFTADDGVHGTELWSSDGTEAGTRMLLDINPSGRSLPMQLTVLGRQALFTADNGVTGSEVWITDGSAPGTQLVKDINPAGASNSAYFTPVGGKVVFSADDGQSGIELWVTDGTETGTQQIADINPGPANSSPLEFVHAGKRAFFVALVDADPATRTARTQLWTTDGTAEGTRQVWEAPGRLSGYSIRYVTLLDNQLLFRAPTGVDEAGLGTDFELFSLPLEAVGD
jgi:ELWxxDGT repeat protein